MSYIRKYPEARPLIEQFTTARRLQEAFGVNPLGSDGSILPARVIDALDVISIEDIRVANAMNSTSGGHRPEDE